MINFFFLPLSFNSMVLILMFKTKVIMNKFIWIILGMVLSLGAHAQSHAGMSAWVTLYEKYQPAKITMENGKVIKQNQANVFLKNARLLFKRGMFDMEANMSQIKKVEFADRSFERLDTMLATALDTVGTNRILCTTTIDIEAYRHRSANDKVVTHLSIGEQVATNTIDLAASDEPKYPLVNNYYFEIDGEIMKVHERNIMRTLDKEKRRYLKTLMLMPDFDWGNREYLKKVLELYKK